MNGCTCQMIWRTEMEIIKKDLIEDIFQYDIILVGVGIKNSLGNGFQHKVFRNFPEVKKVHSNTPYNDVKKLGTVKVVKTNPIFCICYITKGRYRPDIYPDAVDYPSLESCLSLISENFKDKKIASTILGESIFEGGGDRKKILNLFEKYLPNATLYDYEQIDFRVEDNHIYKDNEDKVLRREITTEEYYENKRNILWQNRYGIYREMPEEFRVMPFRTFFKKYKDYE